ncbi:hypothetical protein SMMN14_04038 [Sphaerulina musiva]
MSEIIYKALRTVDATTAKPQPSATRESMEEEEEPTASTTSSTNNKKTATPILTSTILLKSSSTPTIDSLVPTTMATLASSSSSSTWNYPYPSGTAAAKANNINSTTSSNSDLEKVKAKLHTYKMHYRNMIIALTCFALLLVGFAAFKAWRWKKNRSSAILGGAAARGARKWYKSSSSHKNRSEDIEISRPQRPATGWSPLRGPGGVHMI